MKAVISLAQAVKALESGGRPKGGALTGNGVPSLGGEHISASGEFKVDNVKYIPIEYFERIPKAHIKKDDLLLVKDGATTGKLAFVDSLFPYTQAAVNEHVFRIEPNLNIVWPKYLFHYLNSPKGQLQITKNIRGAAIGGINKTILNTIFIPDISIPEQRRIAATLDKADAIRRKRQEALKLVDDLVKSQFIEMFGDPVTNPMGWESETIRGVAKRVSDGPFGSNLKSEHYAPDGVRVIRLQNIGVRQFLDTDKAFVSLEHYENIKKYTCHAGDVVIGTLGEPNLRACIVPEHIERAINKADCVHFVPNENKVNGLFVCHYLNQPATLGLAGGSIHGQTRARISMSQVAALPIFLPPLSLQNQFARFVEQADKSKFIMQRQLNEIETLSSALKQEFFA